MGIKSHKIIIMIFIIIPLAVVIAVLCTFIVRVSCMGHYRLRSNLSYHLFGQHNNHNLDSLLHILSNPLHCYNNISCVFCNLAYTFKPRVH